MERGNFFDSRTGKYYNTRTEYLKAILFTRVGILSSLKKHMDNKRRKRLKK